MENQVYHFRLAQLASGLPELMHPPEGAQEALYVGAHPGRMQLAPEMSRAGYELTLLDIWQANIAHFLDKPGPFTTIWQGDVRNVAAIVKRRRHTTKPFPVSVWWHGPEHVTLDELSLVLAGLESVTRDLVVLGCPWGRNPQGAAYGNPHEKHVAHLVKSDLEELGYEVVGLGELNKLWSSLLAWKWIRPWPKED